MPLGAPSTPEDTEAHDFFFRYEQGYSDFFLIIFAPILPTAALTDILVMKK